MSPFSAVRSPPAAWLLLVLEAGRYLGTSAPPLSVRCPQPQVKLQFESRDAAAVEKAAEAAREQLDTFTLPGQPA